MIRSRTIAFNHAHSRYLEVETEGTRRQYLGPLDMGQLNYKHSIWPELCPTH